MNTLPGDQKIGVLTRGILCGSEKDVINKIKGLANLQNQLYLHANVCIICIYVVLDFLKRIACNVCSKNL